MKHMQLGDITTPISAQHQELLELATIVNEQEHLRVTGQSAQLNKYDDQYNIMFPFYAADPREDDIVAHVHQSLQETSSGCPQFRGVKIYPNLGYAPDDLKLLQIYGICVAHNVPVMSHCSPGGVWQLGLTLESRKKLSCPSAYKQVLAAHPTLRLCLAHFGGENSWSEWLAPNRVKQETNASPSMASEKAWVREIADMIRSGEYPNLYTDVSYTIFSRYLEASVIDYIDYLKVLLTDPRILTRVLYGSDFYMNELADYSEKHLSIALRSRLGDDVYAQIAHHNPKRYLGI